MMAWLGFYGVVTLGYAVLGGLAWTLRAGYRKAARESAQFRAELARDLPALLREQAD